MIKFVKILKEEHNGSEGLEAVLVSPIMFGTFFVLMYFFFMTLTFISFNNAANSIAQELNMRQTGYQTAMFVSPNMPLIRVDGGDLNGGSSFPYLEPGQVNIEPRTKALESGTYYALNKHKKQLLIPFSNITKIDVFSTKPVNPSDGKAMAGTVIRVQIHYKTMSLGSSKGGLIPMTAVGYGIIA